MHLALTNTHLDYGDFIRFSSPAVRRVSSAGVANPFPFRYQVVKTFAWQKHMEKPTKKEKKTVSLNLRVSPRTRAALLSIGERENRNIVNTIEWLVADYHRRNKITIPTKEVE
ncbi:MAG: hypothetical protein E6R09_08140 [Rhodocyclaceae bacterium]|nr:MAG: hypothetical protein E6R09_08140 [Rhodocyclaceae bacterium]